MAEINYCQNLWTQFAKVIAAQQSATNSLDIANTGGDIDNFRRSLVNLNNELVSTRELWGSYFVQLESGETILKFQYETLKSFQFEYQTRLEEILNRCTIRDGQIVELNLSEKHILNPEKLQELTSLEKLNIELTDTTDINFAQHLIKLREFIFDKATDLSPLSKLNDLEILAGGLSKENDLSKIAGLNKLTRINFYVKDSEVDFSPLIGKLPELADVTLLGHTSEQTLEVIATAPKLETLTLYCARIENIKPIVRMGNLKTFGIISSDGLNGPVDLNPISGHQLEKLVLNHSKITDISPVVSLPENCEVFLIGINAIAEDDQQENLEIMRQRGATINIGQFRKY